MVENVGVLGHKFGCLTFDVGQTAHDGRPQVFDLFRRICGTVIHNGINVALLVQFRGGDTHVLSAFLPRKVQTPGNARQARRLDGAKYAITQRQNQITGRQRNGATGITDPKNNAHVGNVHIAH